MKLPYISVRDSVLFPKTSANIFVDRKASLHALLLAETQYDKQLVLITQKKTEQDKPASKADLYSTGTLCKMSGIIRLQDGSVLVCFEGLKKFKIQNLDFKKTFLVTGNLVQNKPTTSKALAKSEKIALINLFVRAKPFIVFDEDLQWLRDWLNLKSESQMGEAIQDRLKHTNTLGPKIRPWEKKTSKECRLINQRNFLMQMILEANNPAARILKIKSYLLHEIKIGLLKG